MTQTLPRKSRFFQMNVDLMHGPIFSSLVLFMLPILVSNLFQQLYNTVDTMIVGNVLGDNALAAIGSCGSIYELLVGFGIGIGNGLAIVAARSYGAQDEDLLKRTVAGSIVIGLAAVIIGEVVFSRIFRNFALKLLGVSLGAVIYYIVIQFVLTAGLNTNDLKLITALVVAIFLAIPYWKGKYFHASVKSGKEER